jgi:hypothetical protein
MSTFYRNNADMVSIEGIPVDAGSLWQYDDNVKLLVLDDDDQYATATLNLESFEKAL